MAASNGKAVLSYGTLLHVKDPKTNEWMDVGGLTDYNGPQSTRAEIEVTRLNSKSKEYVLDLKDNGTFSGTIQTMLGDPGQKLVYGNLDSSDALTFRLTLPDDGYGNGEVPITFQALVQDFPITGSPGQVITTDLSLRITGEVEIELPSEE